MATMQVEPARAAAVRDLLQTLLKAIRDYKTYPRGNPVLERRRNELHQKFGSVLSREGELLLEVVPDGLRFLGVEVYRNTDPRESLPLRLFRQGVRELRFFGGLSETELDEVIDTLVTAPAEDDQDDDLLTLLWERELQHVRWTVAETPPEEVISRVREVLGAVQRDGPEADPARSAWVLANAVQARDPGREAASLAFTDEEGRLLGELLEQDRQRDLALDVVAVLIEVLRSRLHPEDAVDMLQILRRVVEVSVEGRQFGRAATILRHLRDAAAGVPELAPGIEAILQHLARPGFVETLVSSATTATELDGRGLFQLITLLAPESAGPLTDSFAVLEDARLRRLFCEAIAHLVRSDVRPLVARARDTRWFVPRNVAFILGLAGNPEGLRVLALLTRHPHPRVRTEAFRSLARLAPAGVGEVAIRALDDADASVRQAALEAAATDHAPQNQKRLAEQLGARTFGRRPPAEKQALAAVYGRIAGDRALPLLLELLGRRGGALLQPSDEQRLAALAGIRAVGTEEARAALEVAQADPALARLLKTLGADPTAR